MATYSVFDSRTGERVGLRRTFRTMKQAREIASAYASTLPGTLVHIYRTSEKAQVIAEKIIVERTPEHSAAEQIAEQYAIQDACVARRKASPAVFGSQWADGDYDAYYDTLDRIDEIIYQFPPDARDAIYARAAVIANRSN